MKSFKQSTFWAGLLLAMMAAAFAACSPQAAPTIQPTSPTQAPQASTPEALPTFSPAPPASPTVAAAPTDTETALVEATATMAEAETSATPQASRLPDPDSYGWQVVAAGLEAPVGLANAADGSGRLFVLEKVGRIRILQNGELSSGSFLDITDRVGSGSSEQGLLGLAFHPAYPESGYFYVNYTDRSGNTVIARFSVSQDADRADPASEKRLLQVDQPYPNHNGGGMAFGPDGYLYLALGDGGSGGDPFGNGQSLQTYLGKILRIDVDGGDPYAIPPDNPFAGGGGLPEIWAYGLRNPWRFSFDRLTGDLYIADVGQNRWEEIDFLPAGSPGGTNFGWNFREGQHPFQGQPPEGLDLVEPVAEYDHGQGCSVTGGTVYRGANLPQWQGVYLYGDYCTGYVWGLLRLPDGSWRNRLLYQGVAQITSFGEDEMGEIYIADMSGNILRLESKGTAPAAAIPLQGGQATPVGSPGFEPALQSEAMLPEALGDLAGMRDLTRYSIQVEVDYAGRSLAGRSQVVYTNTETVSLESLYFRLLPNGGRSYGNGSLTVSRVRQDGQPLETALSVDDSALEARLAHPLAPGERSQFDLDFAGKIPLNFGQTGYGIYNFTKGVLALADWYPILSVYDQDGWNLNPVSSIGDSVYADMAFYTVELSTQADLAVAATGVEMERRSEGAQMMLRFASGPVREFFMALGDRFQSASKLVGGIAVTSYFLPEHKDAGGEALAVAVQSLDAYNDLFGRYPYKELDVVEVPMNYAAGVEFPGIILVTESLYESFSQPFFTVVVAHEVGHQWWYNLVGNDVFDNPWMDEGLTTYSAALYWGSDKGNAGYQASIEAFQQEYDRILQEGQDDLVTESLSHFESPGNHGSYGAVVYEKAALFFHNVRQAIGDEAFFGALQDYFQAHKYGIAVPDDLLGSFEQAAGRQLDDIYRQWLYTRK